MSHTVCSPVMSMRSSLGPSVTFTLQVGGTRQHGCIREGAGRDAAGQGLLQGGSRQVPGCRRRAGWQAGRYSHIAEQVGPPVPPLEGLHTAAWIN